MNYFDSNNCGQSHHVFLRDDDDHVQAYHSDNTLCEVAEFDFAAMLEGDVERVIECPWCLRKPVDQDHIRKCSDYQPAGLTASEIVDAYSDPTEATKRASLLLSQ